MIMMSVGAAAFASRDRRCPRGIATFGVLLVACGQPGSGPPSSAPIIGSGREGSEPRRTYTLAELPVREWTAGLPVTGNGTLVVELTPASPTDWSTVRGRVDFICDGCTLGDDRSKLQVDTGFGAGVDFGHLTFDSVRARARFADGRVRLVTRWRSPELALDAEVGGTLAPASNDVAIAGCVQFRVADALATRDPKLHAVLTSTGAPRDEHGNYFIKLAGTLGAMRRMGAVCSVSTDAIRDLDQRD